MRGTTLTMVLALVAVAGCKRERTSEPITAREPVADQAVTPELGTAQRIRDRLMQDRTLSPAAQGMTIVVQDNIVTLRGEVATDQERALVDRLATDAAGAAMVRDQLAVIADEATVGGAVAQADVGGGAVREDGTAAPSAHELTQPSPVPATTGERRLAPAPFGIVIVVPSGVPGATPSTAPPVIVGGATTGTGTAGTTTQTQPGLTAPGEAGQLPGTPGAVPGTTAPAPNGISPGTTTTTPSSGTSGGGTSAPASP